MSATNDFLAFATGGSANVETQAAYAADSNRTNGNQPGIASSSFNNKALRQANFVTSTLAQMLTNTLDMDVQDNATPAQLLAQMVAMLQFIPPVITNLTSGSGTFNLTYVFLVSTPSVNPTATATYTDSASTTFTVVRTVTLPGGVVAVYATGGTAPAVGGAPGTLTKVTGTGDTSVTYYGVRAPMSLRCQLVGGGGGGAGSGTPTPGSGGAGGETSFGTSLFSANGGAAGTTTNTAASGGTASINSSASGIALQGGFGVAGSENGSNSVTTVVELAGGNGGSSPFGGAGGGGSIGPGTGQNGITNSGSGGGGGGIGNASSAATGGGGGSGGYVDGYIDFLSGLWASSFAYSIGAAGTAGTAGSSGGSTGGTGGSGHVLVILNFQ